VAVPNGAECPFSWSLGLYKPLVKKDERCRWPLDEPLPCRPVEHSPLCTKAGRQTCCHSGSDREPRCRSTVWGPVLFLRRRCMEPSDLPLHCECSMLRAPCPEHSRLHVLKDHQVRGWMSPPEGGGWASARSRVSGPAAASTLDSSASSRSVSAWSARLCPPAATYNCQAGGQR